MLARHSRRRHFGVQFDELVMVEREQEAAELGMLGQGSLWDIIVVGMGHQGYRTRRWRKETASALSATHRVAIIMYSKSKCRQRPELHQKSSLYLFLSKYNS
jgi:hypothetical protein